jgi:uncharacterized protein
MKIADRCTLPAKPDAVWAALNDPEVLKACLPGCQSLDRVDECHFESIVQVRVGPAAATFRGQVELSDLEPPHRYTIVGQGNAGAAGFAKVTARVELERDGDSTVLAYDADVEIGGKLMSVGARLIQSAAAKNLDAFFGAFQAHIERLTSPTAEAGATAPLQPPQVNVDAASVVGAPSTPSASSMARTGGATVAVKTSRWPAWQIATLAGVVGLVIGFLVGHAG